MRDHPHNPLRISRPAGFLPRVLVCLLAAGSASAQQEPVSTGARVLERLRVIEPGLADADPLASTMRQVERGLRLDDGFDHLYELDGAQGPVYVRRAGGLNAFFSRSIYVPTSLGFSIPVVPAGTVFTIGEPPAWLVEGLDLAGPPAPPPETRLDRRVDLHLDRAIPPETPRQDDRRPAEAWPRAEAFGPPKPERSRPQAHAGPRRGVRALLLDAARTDASR